MKNPHIVCPLWDQSACLRDSAILKSQVLGQMKYLASLGAKITIIFTDPDPENFLQVFNTSGCEHIDFFPVKHHKSLPLLNYLLFSKFRKCLEKINRDKKIDYIYIRNFWVFSFINSKYKTIFDLRGANKEETELSNKKSSITLELKQSIYSYFEKSAFQKADYLQCVSHPLKHYISERFKRHDAAVVSSCIERMKFKNCRDHRQKLRSHYGIKNDETVFIYCGGFSKYQEINIVFKLWAALSKAIPNSYFLLLTNEKIDSIMSDEHIRKIPKGKISISSVDHEEIAPYLAIADFGFLIRKDTMVNKVASPVKFCEYLAAGLGVITTPWVGDISEFLKKNRSGCIIDINETMDRSISIISRTVNDFEKNKLAYASKNQWLANNFFSWDHYEAYYMDRYFA